MENFKIEIEINTNKFLDEVISGALEGGSNFWYLIKEDFSFLKIKYPDKTITESIISELIYNPDFSIPIYDSENEDDILGDLNLKNVKNNFIDKIKNNERLYKSVLNVNNGIGDADDYDVIFQFIVMGIYTFN